MFLSHFTLAGRVVVSRFNSFSVAGRTWQNFLDSAIFPLLFIAKGNPRETERDAASGGVGFFGSSHFASLLQN